MERISALEDITERSGFLECATDRSRADIRLPGKSRIFTEWIQGCVRSKNRSAQRSPPKISRGEANIRPWAKARISTGRISAATNITGKERSGYPPLNISRSAADF